MTETLPPPVPTPRAIIEAYRVYVSSLPEPEKKIRTAVSGGVFTQEDLVEHLGKGDEIGQQAVRAFMESTVQRMKESGRTPLTEAEIIAETARRYHQAAEKIRQSQSI